MRSYIIALCVLSFHTVSYSQRVDSVSIPGQQNDPLQSTQNISSKSLDYVNDKYSKLSNSIQVQSEKVLKRMQEKEAKLQKKLQSIDSTKAKELFSNTKEKYQELQTKLTSTVDNKLQNPLKEYIPGLDSIQTLSKFLNQPTLNIPADKLEQIQGLSSQVKELQGKLQAANEIQSFIREREAQLKASLANTGLAKELLGFNKEVVYYQQRLTEYKELLHDKKKLEDKLLTTVRDLPVFQKFMEKHSYFAQLFPVSPNVGTPQALIGLQTRTDLQQGILQRFNGSGINPQQYVQQQFQTAQTLLKNVKDKLSSLNGSSNSLTIPDFKPNQEKTKKILDRLEYGFNLQNQGKNSFLPATTDVAFTLGYKISDTKVFGVGASYKMGWGTGLDNIRITSEGVGIRSYVDIKAKGSIWISGGFEYNYYQAFDNFQELKSMESWQRSALIGITKKYRVGKKKEGKIQLLYDLLQPKQAPLSQALKFRIGWAL